MYKLLLCLRYLRTRYLAFVCIVSVMLGVATLIVVNSVMSGFSNKLKDRLKNILSDVRIETDRSDGFDDSPEELERKIRSSPSGNSVEALSPNIETFALIQFTVRDRYGRKIPITKQVRLVGVDPAKQAKVGGFSEYLVRQKNSPNPNFDLTPEAKRRFDQNQSLDREGGFDWPQNPQGPPTGEPLGGFLTSPMIRARPEPTPEPVPPPTRATLPPPRPVPPSVPAPLKPVYVEVTIRTPNGVAKHRYKKLPNGDHVYVGVVGPDTEAPKEADPKPKESEPVERPTEPMAVAPLPLPPFIAEVPPAVRPLPPVPLPPPVLSPDAAPRLPGAILGYSMGHFSYTDPETNKTEERAILMPGDEIFIATVGASGTKPVSATFIVADFFKSEMSEYDSSFVYVPLEDLQRIRGMDNRVNAVQIRLKDGVRNDDRFVHREFVPALQELMPKPEAQVQSWQQQQGPLLEAIDIERGILNVLLFLIIGVAGFGVLAIFSMIVSEKYRDIGVMKSLGASSGGILGIFLSYGLMLGVVGCLLGTVAGLLFTHNINEIEGALSRATGQQIFDRKIYYFDQIPTNVETVSVVLVNLGALAICVMSSVLPALRAARLHPVQALRFE